MFIYIHTYIRFYEYMCMCIYIYIYYIHRHNQLYKNVIICKSEFIVYLIYPLGIQHGLLENPPISTFTSRIPQLAMGAFFRVELPEKESKPHPGRLKPHLS